MEGRAGVQVRVSVADVQQCKNHPGPLSDDPALKFADALQTLSLDLSWCHI